jgi:hypothetical protein
MTPVPPQGRGATIPFGAWLAAMLACGGALIFFLFAGMNGHLGVPELVVCTICAFLLAGYILVIGYIYGDARRRGMNAVLWALLAFFAPSAIGIILYFILRSPLPIYCWKCGGAVFNGYPHCPLCGVNVTPVCPSCHRAVQSPWSHCPWCGVKVA